MIKIVKMEDEMCLIKVVKTEDDVNEIAKAIKNYLDSQTYNKDNAIIISQVCDKWGQIITTIVIQ